MKITKKEDIKCPSCGNEDMEKFVFIELTLVTRDAVGFNDKGELLVSEDFGTNIPEDPKKWLECVGCSEGVSIEIDFQIIEEESEEETTLDLEVTKDGVKCPHCENDDIENFTIYEYSTWRDVISLKDGVLLIAGHYDHESGANYGDEHMCCDKCSKKVGLPDGVETDYD